MSTEHPQLLPTAAVTISKILALNLNAKIFGMKTKQQLIDEFVVFSCAIH